MAVAPNSLITKPSYSTSLRPILHLFTEITIFLLSKCPSDSFWCHGIYSKKRLKLQMFDLFRSV